MQLKTGAEELRAIVRVLNYTNESALDDYTAEELVKIVRSCWGSEWDCYPDQLDERQRSEAIRGFPPDWEDDSFSTPVYHENI